MKLTTYKLKKLFSATYFFLASLVLIHGCGIYKKVDTRQVPTNAQERARQAVSEGKGIGIGNILKRDKSYEFSTANALWRASLETLDFVPLTNVDYSGGVIISDWYSYEDSNDSIKISLQFLSNEIRADSLKITVFQKKCKTNMQCATYKATSLIEEELRKKILKTAALLEKNSKEKN